MLSSRVTAMPSSTPLSNVTNVNDRLDVDFALPKPAADILLVPPSPISSGRNLPSPGTTSHAFLDGVGHPPSDTPFPSAPGSPHL